MCVCVCVYIYIHTYTKTEYGPTQTKMKTFLVYMIILLALSVVHGTFSSYTLCTASS